MKRMQRSTRQRVTLTADTVGAVLTQDVVPSASNNMASHLPFNDSRSVFDNVSFYEMSRLQCCMVVLSRLCFLQIAAGSIGPAHFRYCGRPITSSACKAASTLLAYAQKLQPKISIVA